MIIAISAVLGFAFGWRRATHRKGDQNDKIHYGVAHAIAFALAGFVISIIGANLV